MYRIIETALAATIGFVLLGALYYLEWFNLVNEIESVITGFIVAVISYVSSVMIVIEVAGDDWE